MIEVPHYVWLMVALFMLARFLRELVSAAAGAGALQSMQEFKNRRDANE